MATHNALSFLRNLSDRRTFPFVISIAGPQVFLREYVAASIREVLSLKQLDYRGFQVGAGDTFSQVIGELRTPGLFSRASIIACRVLKSRREKSSDSDADGDQGGALKGDEQALADAVEAFRGPSYLVLLYDRDTVPARIRRAVEKSGLAISCNRPFDNQIADYASLFAARLGLTIAPAVLDVVISRYAGDLAAIANSLIKAAINRTDKRPTEVDDLLDPGRTRTPELFDVAHGLASGNTNEIVATIDRAIELGRDPFELLAVEIIPSLRRMLMVAALQSRRVDDRDIARSLGLSPFSPLAVRSIEGARSYGLAALSKAYRAAVGLDSDFKLGRLKNHRQALAGLVLELTVLSKAGASADLP
jgi:DNA polymerase III delta subunit